VRLSELPCPLPLVTTNADPTHYSVSSKNAQYGVAMSKAAAGGASGAVAEATATVVCQGSAAQAEAWTESVAEAVRVDRGTGCVFLDTAMARASARCVNGGARAAAESRTTSELLGGCGLGAASERGPAPGQQASSQASGKSQASATASSSSG